MTLTEFLLTRIVEEEAFIRKGEDLHWGIHVITIEAEERMLADRAAKRGLIDLHSGGHECPGVGQVYWDDREDWTEPCPSLRWLALPYANHTDYDESWRP